MYLLPCGKSPHGVDVDPSGEYVICSGQAPADLDRLLLHEDPGGHRPEGASPASEDGIPVLKYEDALVMEVPVGSRTAAHPVRRQGLRLHLALRRERHRQVEAAALRGGHRSQVAGGGQDPGAVQRRPPGDRAWRHPAPEGRLARGDEQDVEGPLHQDAGRRSRRARSSSTSPARQDGDGLRGLHRARAALRAAGAQGRAEEHDRVLPQGREPRPERDLGRRPTRRSPATRPPGRSRGRCSRSGATSSRAGSRCRRATP